MQNLPLGCSIGSPCSHWLFRFSFLLSNKAVNTITYLYKEVVSLHLSSLFQRNQFSDFFVGGGFSQHVPHLEFLLRTVFFYAAYAEAPVLVELMIPSSKRRVCLNWRLLFMTTDHLLIAICFGLSVPN